MSFVAGIGISIAGGVITDPGYPRVIVGGVPVSVLYDNVAPHGLGEHSSAVMIQGSVRVTAGGRPVCRVGDAASCGHTVENGWTRMDVTA